MKIACPKCRAHVKVDEAHADAHGKVRTRCPECGAKLIVKVNKPELRFSAVAGQKVTDDLDASLAEHLEGLGDVGASDGNGLHRALTEEDSGRAAPSHPPARFNGLDGLSIERDADEAGTLTLVVNSLPHAAMSELRRALFFIPRFGSNPNKISDLLAEPPFVFDGLTATEERDLRSQLRELGAVFGGGEAPSVGPASGDLPEATVDEDRGDVVLCTTELPHSARILGVVSATAFAHDADDEASWDAALADARNKLREQAANLGGTAVAGLRSSVVATLTGRGIVVVEGTAVVD